MSSTKYPVRNMSWGAVIVTIDYYGSLITSSLQEILRETFLSRDKTVQLVRKTQFKATTKAFSQCNSVMTKTFVMDSEYF